jgi:hypothetical protein
VLFHSLELAVPSSLSSDLGSNVVLGFTPASIAKSRVEPSGQLGFVPTRLYVLGDEPKRAENFDDVIERVRIGCLNHGGSLAHFSDLVPIDDRARKQRFVAGGVSQREPNDTHKLKVKAHSGRVT